MKDLSVLISECEYYSHQSLLLAFKEEGKWKFESWGRDIEDNDDWYYQRFHAKSHDKIVRYSDSFRENQDFANWANSRDIKEDEEVGVMLWANFHFLIKGLKRHLHEIRFYLIEEYVQLYKQLEIIIDLGFEKIRYKYEFPKEDDWFFNIDEIKERAVNVCAYYDEEDEAGRGFKHVDFMEFIQRPYKIDSKYFVYTNADGYKIK